ncbi:hypothetical protein SAT01_16130 [Sinomonas atrocyanea]|nr:hypothetical protein SAT01_16130 [Sinomonas atrocyanea]GGG73985.1 hypothetical protein GCM10007172_28330 [Sinomonas atrocyanea]
MSSAIADSASRGTPASTPWPMLTVASKPREIQSLTFSMIQYLMDCDKGLTDEATPQTAKGAWA